MHIQFSLSLHFYLFHLLLNSCNGKDAKQRVFFGRLLVALKRAGCVVCWLNAGFSIEDMMSFCLYAGIQPLSPLTNSFIVIIIIISLLRKHVRRTCLHSKNITMKHTTVILCYTIESYIG